MDNFLRGVRDINHKYIVVGNVDGTNSFDIENVDGTRGHFFSTSDC